MRKTFFAIITMIFFMGLSVTTVAQNLPRTLSDNEIANIIAKSKEVNEQNGIINPDLIYPDQPLTFLFQDGTMVEYRVEEGDNQWSIVKRVLSDTEKYGEIINYGPQTTTAQSQSTGTQPGTVGSNDALSDFIPFIIFLILALLLLLGLLFLILRRNSANTDSYKNPATAGAPFHENGIVYESENEHRDVSRAFQNQYHEPVTNIRRCLISTVGNSRVPVKFADNTTQDLRLRNERGYEGRAANGQLRYILGECANGFALQNHMTPPHLSIVYLSDVPVPEIDKEVGLPTTQQGVVGSQIFDFDAEIVESIASIAAEMHKNGGKLSLELVGLKLMVEVNAPPSVTTSVTSALNGLTGKKEEVSQAS
jgi:hypothetical protein